MASVARAIMEKTSDFWICASCGKVRRPLKINIELYLVLLDVVLQLFSFIRLTGGKFVTKFFPLFTGLLAGLALGAGSGQSEVCPECGGGGTTTRSSANSNETVTDNFVTSSP